MSKRRFGVSTHLYHGQRLSRDHLLEIAGFGFETVEVFATRTHFDYHNPAAVADLQQWLAEAGLALESVHAPINESFAGGRWGRALSVASPDEDERAAAVAETEQALHIARRIAVKVLVIHLGVARGQTPPGGGNARGAARRSLETLKPAAGALGVTIALEVLPNEISTAGSLVHFIEHDLEERDVGICLDFGHAHLDGGDVVDAVETVSEHLVATHVHDNRGRSDDHLVPFDGTIDWPAALTSVQKIGFEGTLLFELAAYPDARSTLARAKQAREKMERLLAV